MKKKDFRVNRNFVCILAVINLVCTSIGIYANVEHWEIPEFILNIGWGIAFATWIIVISDMISNKIYNKTFWIISMFIFPSLAPLFYVIQRNKLLNLEIKKEKYSEAKEY